MRASSVMPRSVSWLFYPFIPRGKITVAAGQMGQAKSLFNVWLAAAVTRGELDLADPASVILFNAEDDVDDTIVPRLAAAGADLNQVWIEPGHTIDAESLAAVCDRVAGELGPIGS
jgi:AAA domain